MTAPYLPWKLAESHGPKTAVRDDNLELTYSELADRVAAIADQFSEHGVGPGDIIAVMLPNRVELLMCMFAAWRLGAAATPINPAFTANEADHQILDSDAKIVVNLGPDMPSAGRPIIAVDDLAVTAKSNVPPPAEPAPGDLALVIYTSGSTGRPKGVMVTHSNATAMVDQMATHMGLTTDDHAMLILPLFHVNAIIVSVLSPISRGGQVTIVGAFSPSNFFDQIKQYRPTYFSAVPTIYALLVTQAEKTTPDLSSVRFAVCGAAPVTKELLVAAEEKLGIKNLIEGYGLTEGTCASACNPIEGVRKLGTVGPALKGQQIKIVDEDLNEVPVGELGEVMISGPTVMQGYLNNPQATAETIIDGWLRTGDIGRVDEDGYLSIVDRAKDMIIRGGENIYPKEIEATIGSLEGVLEVAVVGRPDPILGEVPVAFVVEYPNSGLTDEQVLEHCRNMLTRVKVPVAVFMVEQLPKNPVGKIDKPTLRRNLASAE